MTKISNAILLKYTTEKGIKSGLVTLNLRYTPENDRLDCMGAEFSDNDVEARIRNTSILADIYSLMGNKLSYKNRSSKEPASAVMNV